MLIDVENIPLVHVLSLKL